MQLLLSESRLRICCFCSAFCVFVAKSSIKTYYKRLCNTYDYYRSLMIFTNYDLDITDPVNKFRSSLEADSVGLFDDNVYLNYVTAGNSCS